MEKYYLYKDLPSFLLKKIIFEAKTHTGEIIFGGYVRSTYSHTIKNLIIILNYHRALINEEKEALGQELFPYVFAENNS